MKVKMIIEGKPFQTEFGIVGYSSVTLIQTKGRNILFDTGLKGCALQLKEALKKEGLTCDDITDVVISHMHFDHVGNVSLFQNAHFYVSKTEWIQGIKEPDEWHCVPTCEYLRGKNISFVQEGDVLFPNVTVMELPGHTVGLIGLKCGEDIVLCSDAIKNRYELWQDIPLMSVDLEQSKATMERIKNQAKYIYPGHDQVLDLSHPIDKENLHFQIRFANGRTLDV